VTRLSERLEDTFHAAGIIDKTGTLREALHVLRRYEEAPVVTVTIVGQPGHGGGYDVYSIGNDYEPGNPMRAYAGQLVRILLDTEG
jgi:hypothetical protein